MGGNLQPIDAKVCPEYNQYEQEIQGKKQKLHQKQTNRIRHYVHYVVKYFNFENNLIYMNTRDIDFEHLGRLSPSMAESRASSFQNLRVETMQSSSCIELLPCSFGRSISRT